MQVTQLLKRVRLFNGLSDSQIERVAQLCRKQTFNSGDIILKAQTQSDDMYVIENGLVEIVIAIDEGASGMPEAAGEATIVKLGKGQVFGEMALVDQGLRSATVRCATDGTTLYAIGRDDFMGLCEDDTRIGFVVMKNIAADLSFKLRIRNLAWTR